MLEDRTWRGLPFPVQCHDTAGGLLAVGLSQWPQCALSHQCSFHVGMGETSV